MMHKRRLFVCCVPLTLGLLAGCSQVEDDFPAANSSAERDAAPDIALSAAPGVAFRYDYRFALAARSIAPVQERHAAACEALGLSRCRITGVSFHRQGNDRAWAELDLAMAPDIARKFGKDATAAVEAERGTLAALDIGGADKTPVLDESARASDAARAEQARLAARLNDRTLPSGLRHSLERQLADQRAAESAARREGREAQAAVALTPVHFAYSTNGFMPGLSIDATAMGALRFAAMLLNALFALAVVLATIAVPALAAALAVAHGRQGAMRLWQRLAPRRLEPVEG